MPNYKASIKKRRLGGLYFVVGMILAMSGCASQVQPLILLQTGELHYPFEAQSQSLSGWVDVGYTVQLDGSVINIEVLTSEPEGIFDKAAIDFVRTWKFQPLLKSKEAIVSQSRVGFTLSDDTDLYLSLPL